MLVSIAKWPSYCIICTVLYIAGSLDGMKDLVAESAIMKTVDHPNVLPLLGVCIDYKDEDMLRVVMPFMANGDLKTFLKNNRVTPSNTHEYSKVHMGIDLIILYVTQLLFHVKVNFVYLICMSKLGIYIHN